MQDFPIFSWICWFAYYNGFRCLQLISVDYEHFQSHCVLKEKNSYHSEILINSGCHLKILLSFIYHFSFEELIFLL